MFVARNSPKDKDNIYRVCRMRGNALRDDGELGSQDKASRILQGEGYKISSASLKDYERAETVPSPEVVMALAKVYGTPELRWMHCTASCPIGRKVMKSDSEIGSDDIYGTYFELAGSFDLVEEMERRLHQIIDDRRLTEEEKPALREIVKVMERIAENARDLRIWAEKEGFDLDAE